MSIIALMFAPAAVTFAASVVWRWRRGGAGYAGEPELLDDPFERRESERSEPPTDLGPWQLYGPPTGGQM